METVNWGWVIAGLALLFSVGNAFWTRYVGQKAATESGLNALSTSVTTLGLRVDDLPDRDTVHSIQTEVAALQQKISGMPTSDSIHSIELGMERMRGEMSVLSAELKPISSTVRLIDEYLRTKN